MMAIENLMGSRWDAQWSKQLQNLAKFRVKNPDRWPSFTEEYPKGNRLGHWVARQRDLKSSGKLETSRIAALQKMGFTWEKPDQRDAHWESQFEALKVFRKKYPKRWPYAREEFPKGNRLGLWVWRQRQNAENKLLSKERKSLLEKMGFPLVLPDAWESQFTTLKEYRSKYAKQWPKAREEYPKGNRLGLWCHLQRCAFKAGTLDSSRKRKLEKIGFEWSVKDISWNRYFALLKDYKKKHAKTWPTLEASALEDRRLIAWCSTQRAKLKQGRLDRDKKALLDKLGFRW